MNSKKIYDNEKEELRKRNLELNTMISELEDKNTQLLLEDQKYIKLTNQVLNNVHIEYVWRAVKQVLRDINVNDFTDENYKEIMESACRILTEDKRDFLKQAWNKFLLFFNKKNKIGAKIVNLENFVLKNTRVVMNNDVYKELYRYFTAKKVHNGSLNFLDNEIILKSYPSEKKRKSISNKLRNTRNKTTTYLKKKKNETSKFLKKKRNQTRNFFKNKRQNITQKVGNLRKRLFKKKSNNWRNIYNSKTLKKKNLSFINEHNLGYDNIESPDDNIESPEQILHFTSNKKPKEERNMTNNSNNEINPNEYYYSSNNIENNNNHEHNNNEHNGSSTVYIV